MKKVALIVGSVVIVAAIAALVYRFLSPSGVEGGEEYFDDEDDEDDAKDNEKQDFEQMGIDAYLNEDPEV